MGCFNTWLYFICLVSVIVGSIKGRTDSFSLWVSIKSELLVVSGFMLKSYIFILFYTTLTLKSLIHNTGTKIGSWLVLIILKSLRFDHALLEKFLLFFEVREKLSANISRDRDASALQQLTQALLRTLDVGDPNILTSNDVLYLAQMIEMDRPAVGAEKSKAAAADRMVSIATNYVKMASLMLEPRSANQWTHSTEGVRDSVSLKERM